MILASEPTAPLNGECGLPVSSLLIRDGVTYEESSKRRANVNWVCYLPQPVSAVRADGVAT